MFKGCFGADLCLRTFWQSQKKKMKSKIMLNDLQFIIFNLVKTSALVSGAVKSHADVHASSLFFSPIPSLLFIL